MIAAHVSGVELSYGRRRVVGPLTLAPLRGVVGLLGPNGSGKSTLVRALAGLHPSAGEIRFDGLDGRPLRDALGYLPQGLPAPVALTVTESLLVAGRQGGGLVPRALDLAPALRALDALGISHLADRRLGELSGGQRQLVGMAQVLVREPAVMLLDEPTSALDLHHQVELLGVVRAWAARTGGLAVVVLHEVNLAARFCDDLVVLREGLLAGRGAPADVVVPRVLDDVYRVDARVLRDGDVPVVSAVAATGSSR